MNEKREEIPNKKTEGRKRTRGDEKERKFLTKKTKDEKKKNPERKPEVIKV